MDAKFIMKDGKLYIYYKLVKTVRVAVARSNNKFMVTSKATFTFLQEIPRDLLNFLISKDKDVRYIVTNFYNSYELCYPVNTEVETKDVLWEGVWGGGVFGEFVVDSGCGGGTTAELISGKSYEFVCDRYLEAPLDEEFITTTKEVLDKLSGSVYEWRNHDTANLMIPIISTKRNVVDKVKYQVIIRSKKDFEKMREFLRGFLWPYDTEKVPLRIFTSNSSVIELSKERGFSVTCEEEKEKKHSVLDGTLHDFLREDS